MPEQKKPKRLILLKQESIVCSQINQDVTFAASTHGWVSDELQLQGLHWFITSYLYWKHRPILEFILCSKWFSWLRPLLKRIYFNSLSEDIQLLYFSIGVVQPFLRIFSWLYPKSAIYFMDLWEPLIDAASGCLNHQSGPLIVSTQRGSVILKANLLRQCNSVSWVPEGINTRLFKYIDTIQPPHLEHISLEDFFGFKTIDVLEIGRSCIDVHDQIVDILRLEGFNHVYPSCQSRPMWQSRYQYIETLRNARILLCIPRSLTHPQETGNIEACTLRYYEAMISGCLPVGICPKEAIDIFGYNPVIELELADNIGTQIISILKSFSSYQSLVERNLQEVHRHSWEDRFELIDHLI